MHADSMVAQAARFLFAFLISACAAWAQFPWHDGSWKDKERIGDEARFLNPGEIHRYHLGNKAWLPSVSLPRTGATAMATDDDGMVVAYGTTIYRYGADFSEQTALATVSSNIHSLFLDRNLVIAIHSAGLNGRISIFDRASGSVRSSVDQFLFPLYGASHAPQSNRIYGRTQNTIPPHVLTRSYSEAGQLSQANMSNRQEGDTNTAKTWIFPDEKRLADSTGSVFGTPGLIDADDLGVDGILDIRFNGDVPLVLREGELIAFTSGLTKTGRRAVASNKRSVLFVTDEAAFVFTPFLNASPVVEIIPLSDLNAIQPGTPVDPNGLPYHVDNAFVDRNGDLMLLSASKLNLFRWSPEQRSYTGGFPLRGIPSHSAYSEDNNQFFLAYTDREIHRMDLDSDTPGETSFFTMPMPLYHGGLATAGDFVFAVNPSGSMHTHYILSPEGTVLASAGERARSRVHEWDPVKRRMYFLRDRVTPHLLHYDRIDPDGNITDSGQADDSGTLPVAAPLRISQDGSKIALGSGVIVETDGFTRVGGELPGFADALWRGGSLVTIHASGTHTRLRQWDAETFAEVGTLPTVPGTPVRILAIDESRIVLITQENGIPRIHLLDGSLAIIHTFISELQFTVESEPTLSRLTGLFEQRVTVTNVGQRAIAGFELSITGLREGVTLYNGSSDGNGGGIIFHHQPVPAGESVTLVLEYFATPRGTVPTPVISASLASSAASPPQAGGSVPPFEINRMIRQADGTMVIEFNAIPGEQYVVHYSADAANWTPCPLPIQAGGTKVQWIDRGPPWTASHPSSTPQRFYRVQHLNH